MLGMVGDDIDHEEGGSQRYSQQSSVVSQWEDRIMSGDEDGEMEGDKRTESLDQNKTDPPPASMEGEQYHFHDMSKDIPDNLKTNLSHSPKIIRKVQGTNDKDHENGESAFAPGTLQPAFMQTFSAVGK